MGRIEVGDAKLRFWEQGSGPAVVLIHGAGTPGEPWTDDLAFLADRYRVITYNRRGYPGSGEPPASWEAHGEDAAGLIERLDAAPAALVGYSAGAIAALWVALNRPELVDRLILVDPAVHAAKGITPKFAATYARMQTERRVRSPQTAVTTWMRYVTARESGGSAWEDEAMSDERRQTILDAAEAVLADFDLGDGREVELDAARSIDRPCFMIDAAESPPFLRKSAARLREAIPHARVTTIEASGHALLLDQPERFREALEEALTAV